MHEEDSAAGEAYRPDTADIPLSRRPRTALELDADGSARVWSADAADRPQATAARWHEDGGVVTVEISATEARPAARLRIVERRRGLLRIKR